MAAVADELIIRVLADVKSALDGLKQVQNEMGKTNQAATSGISVSGLKRSFGEINKYYELVGDSAGATKEKMSLLSGSLRTLVKDGKGNSDMAQRLSGVYQSLQKQSLGAKDGIGGILSTLSRSVPGMGQLTSTMGQLSAAFPQLAAAAGPVGVAIAAIGAAYKFVVMPGIEFNAMLEQQAVAFTAMLKSGEQATYMLSQLKQLSLTTPIGLQEGAQSAKQLLAYGFAQDEIIDNLKMMKTVAGAVNVSLGDLAYVYGTLRSQGRAYTRDLMQFAMRGIPIYEYLGKTMGVTTVELKKMTEEGKVGFKDVEKAMQAMTGKGGKFNGMLEASMKTTQGLKTQIKNTWALFTGDAARGSSVLFKGLLKNVLSFVKVLQSLGPSFNVLFSVISGIIVLIADIFLVSFQAVAFIDKLLQNIVLSIIDGVKWLASWGDGFSNISNFFKGMGKGMSDFNSWLVTSIPVLRTILDLAGKVGNAIEKWWNRTTTSNAPKQFVSGEFSQIFAEGSKQVKMLDAQFRNVDIGGDKRAIGSIAEVALKYGVSVDSILRAMATFKSISQATFDDVLNRTENFIAINADYWEKYRMNIVDASKFPDVSRESGKHLVDSALKSVEEALTTSTGFTDTKAMAKLLGMDPETAKKAIDKPSQEIADQLYKQIEKMRTMGEYQKIGGKDTPGSIFFQGLIDMWKKYNTEVDKAGKTAKDKTGGLLGDILDQYIAFRAEWVTVEGQFSASLIDAINERIGGNAEIRNNATMYDRQIEVINKKYNDMYKDLEEVADKYALSPFSVTEAIEEMRRIELLSTDYSRQLKENQDRASITMSGRESVALMNEEFDIQLRINELKALGGQLSIEDQKTIIALQAKQATMMKEGNQAAYDRLTNSLMTEGTVGGKIQGSYLGAAKGSDIGNLIAGANPLVGALTAFAEMITSIESVSKVLNFFGTIMEGMKTMLDGVTGTLKSTTAETEKGVATIKGQTVQVGGMITRVLTPLVKILTIIGEIFGVVLVPIIEVFADYLNTFLQPVLFILDILKQFIIVLQPLIKLIMYIQNPFLILGALLKDFVDGLGALVQTESDRQKDLEDLYGKELATLQNLYEVGALSGAQYEQRLAELKAKYGKNEEAGTESPMASVLAGMMEAFGELGAALSALMEALKPAMDAIAGPLVATLVAIITILVDLIVGISDILTGVSNVLTGILTWNWDLVKQGFSQVLMGALSFVLNPIITLLNFLGDGIDAIWPGADFIPHIPKLATGTGMVPKEMMAILHPGESVVPRDFMDSIRSGDLALTGGSAGGGNIYISVTAQGDIITERDLAKKLTNTIYDLKRKGHI